MFVRTKFQDANKDAESNTFNAVENEVQVKYNDFKSR